MAGTVGAVTDAAPGARPRRPRRPQGATTVTGTDIGRHG